MQHSVFYEDICSQWYRGIAIWYPHRIPIPCLGPFYRQTYNYFLDSKCKDFTELETNQCIFICFLLWRYPRCPPLCGRRFSVGWSWNQQRWYYRYVAVGPFNEFKQKRPLEKCLAKKEHVMTLWLNPKRPKAGSGLSYIDWIGYLLFIELPWLYPEGS